MFKVTSIRSLLLVAIGVLSIFAVVSASASAAECMKEANKKFVLCIGEPPILTVGTKTLHILEQTSKPLSILKSAGAEIKCSGVLLTKEPVITGTATSVKLNKVILHLTGCTMPIPAHCRVQNELIITLSLEGVVKTKDMVLLFPEEEGNHHFATVVVESIGGTCLLVGKLNIITAKENHEEGPLYEAPGLEVIGTKQAWRLPGTTATTSLKLGGESLTLSGELLTEVLDQNGAVLKFSVVEGK
jgi:hypothetical protein